MLTATMPQASTDIRLVLNLRDTIAESPMTAAHDHQVSVTATIEPNSASRALADSVLTTSEHGRQHG